MTTRIIDVTIYILWRKYDSCDNNGKANAANVERRTNTFRIIKVTDDVWANVYQLLVLYESNLFEKLKAF